MTVKAERTYSHSSFKITYFVLGEIVSPLFATFPKLDTVFDYFNFRHTIPNVRHIFYLVQRTNKNQIRIMTTNRI